MPTNDQAQADQLDSTQTADGNAGAPEAPATASENQSATTTADSAPAKEGVAAMDDYMMRLQEALAPAPEGEAATDDTQAGVNPPAPEGSDAPPAEDASQANPPAPEAGNDTPPASEDDTAQGKREFRPRLSSLDDRQKEAILLVKELKEKGESLSLAEAEARVNAKYGITSDSEKQTEAAQPAPTPDDLKAQIDQLKADRRKAAEDMDTLKLAELSEQIEDLQLQFLEAREAAKAADLTAEQQFQQQVADSRAKRDSVYPAAAEPNHAIHAEAERIWTAMQDQQNPLIFDADAPFKVYQMAANALGIAPSSSSTKSSPAPTPRPQAVQQSAVRRPTQQSPVASGGDRTSQPTTASPLQNGKPRSVFEYEQLVHGLT